MGDRSRDGGAVNRSCGLQQRLSPAAPAPAILATCVCPGLASESPGHRGRIPATLETSSGARGHPDRLVYAPGGGAGGLG